MTALICSVGLGASHGFRKQTTGMVTLIANHGVAGDAHAGVTVKHRSRVASDPTQPNLRQVHLIHGELFDELREQGFDVQPGDLGENVCTRGVELLALSAGTRLRLGSDAVIELTGLRNPCTQLDAFAPGLMRALTPRDAAGNIVRKCGVMAVVLCGGEVRVGDKIAVQHVPEVHVAMGVV